MWPFVRRHRLELSRRRAKAGPSLTNFPPPPSLVVSTGFGLVSGNLWPRIGQLWTNSAECGPLDEPHPQQLVRRCPNLKPGFERLRPSLAHFSANLAELLPNLGEFDRLRPHSWPDVAKHRSTISSQLSVQIGPDPATARRLPLLLCDSSLQSMRKSEALTQVFRGPGCQPPKRP